MHIGKITTWYFPFGESRLKPGKPAYINARNITHASPHDDKVTKVHFTDGTSILADTEEFEAFISRRGAGWPWRRRKA